MKQIRKGVFETNSSSVHSLQISREGLEPSNLEINKDGNIEVEFGAFDKDERIYNTQYEKLQYLLSFIAYNRGFYYNPSDLDDLYECYDFNNVCEAICDYTGAKGIVIVGDKDAYIDHQSMDDCVIDYWYQDNVINFIFNKYVALRTECD